MWGGWEADEDEDEDGEGEARHMRMGASSGGGWLRWRPDRPTPEGGGGMSRAVIGHRVTAAHAPALFGGRCSHSLTAEGEPRWCGLYT